MGETGRGLSGGEANGVFRLREPYLHACPEGRLGALDRAATRTGGTAPIEGGPGGSTNAAGGPTLVPSAAVGWRRPVTSMS